MKKLLLMIFTLSLFLTGCGSKSDYEQMVSEIEPITKADGIKMIVGATINGTDSELDGTNYELIYTFNTKDDVILVDVNEVTMYLTSDTLYIDLLGKWIQKDIDLKNYGEIQEAIAYKDFILNLPKGNQQLVTDTTGITSIDKALEGQTYNDAVISTGDGTYSISGLEDQLSINTTNGLRIDFNDDQTGAIYFDYQPVEKIIIPDEVLNATSADDVVNSLGTMLDGGNNV